MQRRVISYVVRNITNFQVNCGCLSTCSSVHTYISLNSPGNKSLLGVELVGEEELVVTNETVNFHWKDHGFKLHIPENAIPEGVSEYSVKLKPL